MKKKTIGDYLALAEPFTEPTDNRFAWDGLYNEARQLAQKFFEGYNETPTPDYLNQITIGYQEDLALKALIIPPHWSKLIECRRCGLNLGPVAAQEGLLEACPWCDTEIGGARLKAEGGLVHESPITPEMEARAEASIAKKLENDPDSFPF